MHRLSNANIDYSAQEPSTTLYLLVVLHLCPGAGDIVGGNLKLILGLIWKLILHYQIMAIESAPQESPQREEKKRMLFAKDVLRNYVQVSHDHLYSRAYNLNYCMVLLFLLRIVSRPGMSQISPLTGVMAHS